MSKIPKNLVTSFVDGPEECVYLHKISKNAHGRYEKGDKDLKTQNHYPTVSMGSH